MNGNFSSELDNPRERIHSRKACSMKEEVRTLGNFV